MTTAPFMQTYVPTATDGRARPDRARPSWFARMVAAIHRAQEARARREIARVAPFLPETVLIQGELRETALRASGQLPFNR